MKILARTGNSDLATVYMADMGEGRLIEFVEACQPPHGRAERWVLMVSTLFGCPVKCLFCDAGGGYRGKPTADEILMQIDHMVAEWFPGGIVTASKFKIQFARMGEPALNPAVLEVLERLPGLYTAPGLMPSISTVAPASCDRFFEGLLKVKQERYSGGHFQFQFSLHTTDAALRDRLIPVRKWSFAEMAAYGERFWATGDRKITLNFALARQNPLEASVLLQHFSPEKFLVKITPLNPTYRALQNNLVSYIDPGEPDPRSEIVVSLHSAGYEVIVSIGETEENQVGSNCGQYLRTHLEACQKLGAGYTYPLVEYES